MTLKNALFTGSAVALVTPMHADGAVDHAALSQLIDWHLAANTAAFIIAGTTGESATLDPAEHASLLNRAIQQVGRRVPVIAGTGTNSTRTTIKLTQAAEAAGADGCLIVTPYYNKPTQRGLFEHYKAIAASTHLPLILYNVPSRTGCDLRPETVAELMSFQNIVAIKEAAGKVERIQALRQCCGPDFVIYSGDDATALDAMQNGANGVISVTANVMPRSMHALCRAALANEVALAARLNDKLALLHERLFIESNPAPVKWALSSMNKIQTGIRLPLMPLDPRHHDAVKEALQIANHLETELEIAAKQEL